MDESVHLGLGRALVSLGFLLACPVLKDLVEMRKSKSPQLHSALWRDLSLYWLEHPEAQDTLEGIAQWWLLEQRIRQTTADLKAALHELSHEGFVQERRQKDGRISYGLNRARQAELRSLLTGCRARGRSVGRRGSTAGRKRKSTDL